MAISRSSMLVLGVGLAFIFAHYLRIMDAPALTFHKYREADTVNLILNYASGEADLFYPRSHHRGKSSGVIGTELPVLYYLSSQLIDPEGHYYFVLRVIQFGFYIFLVLGTYTLFRRLEFRDELAALATFLMTCNPMLLFYGLKIMPEVHYAAIGTWGAVFLLDAITLRSILRSVGAALFLGLAAAIKPFAAIFFVPIALHLLHKRDLRKLTWLMFFGIGICSASLMLLWFRHSWELRHANPFSNFAVNFRWSAQLAAWTNPEFYLRLIFEYGTELFISFGGVALLLYSLIKSKGRLNFSHSVQTIGLPWLLLAFGMVILLGSNHILRMHDYYGLILLAPIALIIADLVLRTNPSYLMLGMLLAAYLGLSAGRIYQRFVPPDYSYVDIQRGARESLAPGKRVIVRDVFPPFKLNLLNRHGIALGLHDSDEHIEKAIKETGFTYACVNEAATCERLASRPEFHMKLIHGLKYPLGFVEYKPNRS